MPASSLYFKDRKTTIRLTIFVLIILCVCGLIGVFFPDINKQKIQKENVVNSKAITDTLK